MFIPDEIPYFEDWGKHLRKEHNQLDTEFTNSYYTLWKTALDLPNAMAAAYSLCMYILPMPVVDKLGMYALT